MRTRMFSLYFLFNVVKILRVICKYPIVRPAVLEKFITFWAQNIFFYAASSCFSRHEILFRATATRFCRNQITFYATSKFLFQHKIIFRTTPSFCFGHRLECYVMVIYFYYHIATKIYNHVSKNINFHFYMTQKN